MFVNAYKRFSTLIHLIIVFCKEFLPVENGEALYPFWANMPNQIDGRLSLVFHRLDLQLACSWARLQGCS